MCKHSLPLEPLGIDDVRADIRRELRRLCDALPVGHKHELYWLVGAVLVESNPAWAATEAAPTACQDAGREALRLGLPDSGAVQ